MAYYQQQIDAIKQVTDKFNLFENNYADTSFNTIFTYTVQENSSSVLAFTVAAKEINGTGSASFIRHFLVNRQTGGMAQIESVPHASFTQKNSDNFDINIIQSGNDVLFQVKNLNGIETKWQGNVIVNGTN